jgi:hypothetical protein
VTVETGLRDHHSNRPVHGAAVYGDALLGSPR